MVYACVFLVAPLFRRLNVQAGFSINSTMHCLRNLFFLFLNAPRPNDLSQVFTANGFPPSADFSSTETFPVPRFSRVFCMRDS